MPTGMCLHTGITSVKFHYINKVKSKRWNHSIIIRNNQKTVPLTSNQTRGKALRYILLPTCQEARGDQKCRCPLVEIVDLRSEYSSTHPLWKASVLTPLSPRCQTTQNYPRDLKRVAQIKEQNNILQPINKSVNFHNSEFILISVFMLVELYQLTTH